MMPANELAAVIVKALDAKKGENIQLLKTRDLTTLADYFVICTAGSSTHVKTLTDAVEAAADAVDEPVLRREGHRSGSWVLLDYGCVIVHVIQDEARKFYDLERLWSDAEVIDITGMRAGAHSNRSGRSSRRPAYQFLIFSERSERYEV